MHKQNQKQSVFHEHLESWEIWAVYNEKYWYICIVREPVTLTMLLLWEQSLLTSCWPRPAILPDWSRWDRLFLGKSREAHMVGRSLSNLLFWFWLLGPPPPHFWLQTQKLAPTNQWAFFFLIILNQVCCYKMQMSSSTSWHDVFPINTEMICLVSLISLYLLFCS